MKFVIPWFVRLEIDTWLALSPVILMTWYPFTVFTPFMEKHRKRRKRNFSNFALVESPSHNIDDVKRIYTDLGFKEHY